MLDVVFLSYNEPNKEENWERLRSKVPWAKRVDGVKGIPEAHIECARVARTEMFYVVDGDSEIINFPLRFKPKLKDKHAVHVWRSINPVNDMIYGYGGLKLFPRKPILEVDPKQIVDFTTSVGTHFVSVSEVASKTCFNTGPFESWRSGFREAAKLSSAIIHNHDPQLNEERLEIWCTKGSSKPYGEWTIAGALEGKKFGEKYISSKEILQRINDYTWLKERFDEFRQSHSEAAST